MTTKRGEQGYSEAPLDEEGLQGAQKAVAHEVAAAEPEMPPLLEEPPPEVEPLAVVKFEKHAHNAMSTVPLLPAMPTGKPKRLPAFVYPPVFGGAARLFSSFAPSSAEGDVHPPVNSLHNAQEEDGLGETTPNLTLASSYSEEVTAGGVPVPQAIRPRRVVPPRKPPPLASRSEAPTQPWLPIVQPAEETRTPQHAKSEAPETKPVSAWLVWSIAVALSVLVATGVFFMYEGGKPSVVAVKQPESAVPSSQNAAAAQTEKSAQVSPPSQNTVSDVSADARLALAPSSAPSSATSPPQAPPPAIQEEEDSVPETAEAPGDTKETDEASPNPAAATLDLSPAVASRPKPEQPPEERVFFAGLEAAKRHVHEEQFARALRELDRLQSLHKKYPARTSEYNFLYAVSLAFAGKDARHTSKALQLLEPLRNTYRRNPDYWLALGFANQMLGTDEAKPVQARCTHLRQAKSAYTELLRWGRNIPRYMQASSYIENIEHDLQGMCG